MNLTSIRKLKDWNKYGTIIVPGVLLSIGTLVVLMSLELPYGHNGAFNIQNLIGFNEQFAQGVLYPRWINYVNGGGSPTFFFYGPLPYWIAALIQLALCIDCSPEQVLGISLGLMFVASGAAAYLLFRQHAPRSTSLFGASVYMMLPYHLAADGWWRSALGEVAAYIFIPLIFWALDQLPQRRAAAPLLGIFYAGLIFSHLPSALLTSIIIAIHIGFIIWERRNGLYFVIGAGAIIAGMALAAIDLVPAILLQDTIHAEIWWGQRFRAVRWLIGGGNHPASGDMRFIEGVFFSTTLIFIYSILAIPYKNFPQLIWRWIASVSACVFLMSVLSTPIWVYAPLLSKVQFPWRLMTIVDLAAAQALVSGLVLHGRSKIQSALVKCAVGVAVSTGAYSLAYAPVLDLHMQVAGRKHQAGVLAENLGALEYIPKEVATFPQISTRVRRSRGKIAWLGNGEIVEVSYDGDSLYANVKIAEPTILILPRFYYRSWIVVRNGEPVAPSLDLDTGLLSINLPAGQQFIEVARRRLWPETVGAFVSGTAGVILLIWLGVAILHRERRRVPE
jgi:hypothetical protein